MRAHESLHFQSEAKIARAKRKTPDLGTGSPRHLSVGLVSSTKITTFDSRTMLAYTITITNTYSRIGSSSTALDVWLYVSGRTMHKLLW